MEIGLLLLSIVVGYVFGSLSFTRLIARIIIPDEDISSTRFEIPGKDIGMDMTSVSPTALSMRKGPGAGCSASILDMLKWPALSASSIYMASRSLDQQRSRPIPILISNLENPSKKLSVLKK